MSPYNCLNKLEKSWKGSKKLESWNPDPDARQKAGSCVASWKAAARKGCGELERA